MTTSVTTLTIALINQKTGLLMHFRGGSLAQSPSTGMQVIITVSANASPDRDTNERRISQTLCNVGNGKQRLYCKRNAALTVAMAS